MSVVSDAVRAAVVARAGDRCEYCRLPTRGQVATFPVDHVRPRTAGGTDDPNNLALACPRCNGHKWAATDATDPDTGAVAPLFNPRADVWADHFAWSAAAPGQLVARTPIGRATVARLRMNDPTVVALRVLLADIGLFPEVTGGEDVEARRGADRPAAGGGAVSTSPSGPP
ncbi:HNH endonuclease [Urbifossiella limnaea]|uniref:HNH endonuclease n=1 Tax=Urbifossiella limnaea TaxID=2528023 RepID=A0A517Y2R9_9BACT|nr:HNH endonuclease signature motif containing protein [Urbifossiella limnaea]QDU24077.1 HNH endonuclease [Urbifossiella limnaea]